MKTMESPKAALIAYRTDILAQVALTVREDVSLSKFDLGQLKTASTGFIATINPDDKLFVPRFLAFAVAAWGTDKPINTEEAATRWMNRQQKDYVIYNLPSIALLFSMVGDTGYYAWTLEPILDPDTNKSRLVPVERLICSKMDKKALDDIVNKIKEYYRAYPG